MANLQSSGAISLSDIKNLFGGPTSPSLNDYYRGGSYIPSTKTITVNTTVREPASGENYSQTGSYYWNTDNGSWYWAGTFIGYALGTSITSGAYTYYRGNLQASYTYSTGGYSYATRYYYGIYRTSGGTSYSTTNINTGIPTSGTISLSQFYGAEKP